MPKDESLAILLLVTQREEKG